MVYLTTPQNASYRKSKFYIILKCNSIFISWLFWPFIRVWPNYSLFKVHQLVVQIIMKRLVKFFPFLATAGVFNVILQIRISFAGIQNSNISYGGFRSSSIGIFLSKFCYKLIASVNSSRSPMLYFGMSFL